MWFILTKLIGKQKVEKPFAHTGLGSLLVHIILIQIEQIFLFHAWTVSINVEPLPFPMQK